MNEVSSQITIEVVDKDRAVRAFEAGLATHIGRRLDVPANKSYDWMSGNRDIGMLFDDIETVIGAKLANWNLSELFDSKLIAAFLAGDVLHKIATGRRGNVDWSGAAGNIKGWRKLFPKSHPNQIVLMSFTARNLDGTVPNIAAANVADLRLALRASKDLVVDLCKSFVADQIGKKSFHFEVDHGPGALRRLREHQAANNNPTDVDADLNTYLNSFDATGNWLRAEFDHAAAAMTDAALSVANAYVARSKSFATHGLNDAAFAFEDREEVRDRFPDLRATFGRLEELAKTF